MEDLSRFISEHPFFSNLEKQHLETVVGCASNIRFSPSEFILRAGQREDFFYLVRHGTVALEVHGPQIGTVRIQTVNAGGVLGWSWLFPPYRAHFDARAIDLTRAIRFDGSCLRGKMDSDHSLGYELLKRFSIVVTRRLEATQLQLLDLYATRTLH